MMTDRKHCDEIVIECANCKKKLQENGEFCHEHCVKAQISSTICPDCFNILYKETHDNVLE